MYSLLPSPSNFSKIASCSSEGHLAYGSNKCIVLIWPLKTHQLNNFNCLDCDWKVVNVSFSEPTNTNERFFLASACSNGCIIIWNVQDRKQCFKHHKHKQQKVVDLDWTRAGGFLLVSTDTAGNLSIFNAATGDVRNLSLLISLHLKPSSLACSLTQKELVAVGCSDGLVAVLNIEGAGSVLSVLDGHDDSVLSLSWCPIDLTTETSESSGHPLFASATSECVAVWNYTERQCIKSFSVPKVNLHKLPVLLKWIDPKVLISSFPQSEFLRWNPLAKNIESKRIHNWHQHGITCIAVQRENNGSGSYDVWTMGVDSQLICSSVPVSEKKVTTKKYALGLLNYGKEVNCIAACPTKTNMVAISSEKCWIHIMIMGKSCNTFRVKLTGQKKLVTSLAWHPTEKLALAFGTRNGHIGYICKVKTPAKPLMFTRVHMSRIRSLCWGPPIYEQGSNSHCSGLQLYATSNHDALSFDPNYFDNVEKDIECPNHINLKDIIKASNPNMSAGDQCMYLAWKSDYTVLAIALANKGQIQLFTAPHLYSIDILELKPEDGKATKMAWHPSTVDTSDCAPQDTWLAAVVDKKVFVYDVRNKSTQATGSSCSTDVVAVLFGHKTTIEDLCWNPAIAGWLATASSDCTVKVWDVAIEALLITFEGHNNSIQSCIWSYANPRLLLSGSRDHTVRAWQLPENLQNRLENKAKKKKKMDNNVKKNVDQMHKKHDEEKPLINFKVKNTEDNIKQELINDEASNDHLEEQVCSKEHVKLEVKKENQNVVRTEMDVHVGENIKLEKNEIVQEQMEDEDEDMEEDQEDFDSDNTKEELLEGKRKRVRKKGCKKSKKPVAVEINPCMINLKADPTKILNSLQTNIVNCSVMYDLESPAFSVNGSNSKSWLVAVAIAGKPLHWWTDKKQMALKNSLSLMVEGNVMTTLWNPLMTNEMAFGTDKGFIGFYSVIEMDARKHLTSFRLFPDTAVCRVGWGPCTYTLGAELPRENKFSYLYATNGEEAGFVHRMIMHKGFFPLRPIIEANNPKLDTKAKHTDLAWNSDYSLLALGLSNGCVLLLAPPHLRLVHILHVRQDKVNLLTWHPIVENSICISNPAKERRWLATAADDNKIVVFDLSPLALKGRKWREFGDIDDSVDLQMSILAGHNDKVTCIRWNANIAGQMLTASYDYTVKVWNVFKQELLTTLMGHSGPVLSACWYLHMSATILSTSLDATLRVWMLPSSTYMRKLKKKQKSINMRSEFVSPDEYDS